jgi:hypothetical protein
MEATGLEPVSSGFLAMTASRWLAGRRLQGLLLVLDNFPQHVAERAFVFFAAEFAGNSLKFLSLDGVCRLLWSGG